MIYLCYANCLFGFANFDVYLKDQYFSGEKVVNNIKNDITIIRDKCNIQHITSQNKIDLCL